jgi:LPLT family lysophospholipid transporter-like MFS transporter
LIGVFGGIFLIPMNTILQTVGKDIVGAGKTIAVQNLVENSLTIIGLFIYLYLNTKVPIQFAVVGMGVILLVFILVLLPKLSALKRFDPDEYLKGPHNQPSNNS